MRHELYIDNKKVDLSPSTSINLTYKSNLLNAIDKIVSNYSYTIKLSKTKRNMELIEGCNIPSNNNSFAYLPHRARLLRDGIEIVSDALVALLSVGDDIQISLTWGNSSLFEGLLDSSKGLKDLPFDKFYWKVGESESTPKANYGSDFYQPVIRHADVFQKIQDAAGVSFEYEKPEIWDSLVMPCLNGQTGGSELIPYKVNLVPVAIDLGVVYFDRYKFKENEFFDVIDWDYKWIRGFNINTGAYDYTIKGKVYIYKKPKTGVASINADTKLKFGTQGFYYQSFTNAYIDDRGYAVYVFDLDMKIIGMEVRPEAFKLEVTEFSSLTEEGYASGDISATPLLASEDVEYPTQSAGVRFYYYGALPDISWRDYIKSIMMMFGWFAEPSNDGKIRLLGYDVLELNKPKAVDWSGKILNTRIEPSDISYTISGTAQKNYLSYQEPEFPELNYKAAIYIDNQTLDDSTTLGTVSFAPTKMRNGVAVIELYEYNEEENKYEVNAGLKPRILVQNGTSLTFEGLDWYSLISKHWGKYSEIVKSPKIIKEKVRLNVIDLKNIDMTIPVYISQYGSYFAIIEIKTKKDDICDVQLLKI